MLILGELTGNKYPIKLIDYSIRPIIPEHPHIRDKHFSPSGRRLAVIYAGRYLEVYDIGFPHPKKLISLHNVLKASFIDDERLAILAVVNPVGKRNEYKLGILKIGSNDVDWLKSIYLPDEYEYKLDISTSNTGRIALSHKVVDILDSKGNEISLEFETVKTFFVT